MLIRSFSISVSVLAQLKLRYEDPILDADKLFFLDIDEVSLSPLVVNLT
jgi:hypothetical protein